MVSAPIVLLIAVGTNPDGLATANAAATACLQALPAGARTVVRGAPAVPEDVEIDRAAASVGASAAVVLSWRDSALLVGDVRARMTAADGRVQQTARTMSFTARDLTAERGRALGLVIASILEEGGALTAAPFMAARRAPTSVIDAEAPPGLARSATVPAPVPLRWALEANVITAVDQQEDLDDTIGGLIALRRVLTSQWALRAGFGFRVADLDGADATSRATLFALGVAWASRSFAEGRGLGFGVRADLLGAHEAIKRQDPDDDRTAERWTVGGDLLGQVGLGLGVGTSLLAGAGVEGFASSAMLSGRIPTTIPRGCLIVELGVLSRF